MEFIYVWLLESQSSSPPGGHHRLVSEVHAGNKYHEERAQAA